MNSSKSIRVPFFLTGDETDKGDAPGNGEEQPRDVGVHWVPTELSER
jgi:hypothetical protein